MVLVWLYEVATVGGHCVCGPAAHAGENVGVLHTGSATSVVGFLGAADVSHV